jgi:hypothetical protein
MGYIIEYTKHGTLDESTTITHLVQVLQAASHSAMLHSSTLDKKTVPTLDISMVMMKIIYCTMI